MAQLGYLASMITMGGVLVAVAYLFVRMNSRKAGRGGPRAARYERESASESGSLLGRIARAPASWYVGFVLAMLVVGAGGVAFIGETSLSGSAGAVVGVSMALLLALYLFVGTYATAKSRGRPASLAVAEGLGVIGGLALLGIVLVLVVG